MRDDGTRMPLAHSPVESIPCSILSGSKTGGGEKFPQFMCPGLSLGQPTIPGFCFEGADWR